MRLGTRSREHAELRRKQRTNRMLVAMVTIFVCCWLPLNIVHLVSDYRYEFAHWSYFLLVFFIAHAIAMSSTTYNPFLYAWMNENFRDEFRRVVPCLFRCRRMPAQTATENHSPSSVSHRETTQHKHGSPNLVDQLVDVKCCAQNGNKTEEFMLSVRLTIKAEKEMTCEPV